ncbi:hypothetical protein BDE02_04G062200 [Populus trichocarpa]|nr:hypothetical protein BDE02_04G062200 [Populus trichocarpa]
MQKAMLKLDMHDEKTKKKAMKTVSGFSGVDSISMDWNDKKLTVTGDIDPVNIVKKLRKFCHVEIVSVGEAKEPEKKKEEPEKQEDEKKDVIKTWMSWRGLTGPIILTRPCITMFQVLRMVLMLVSFLNFYFN